jgi:membrane protein YqaA with SNARE-associated domain
LTQLTSSPGPLPVPRRKAWILPATMIAITFVMLIGAELGPQWARLLYLVPYTFLGNSLAPLPYDGAVVYLGSRYALGLIVVVAVAATLVIEVWNMEVLARVLAREGTRSFRSHRVTQRALQWYRKAPFWSLVATCVLPILPHYPMRFLAVLAGFPLWKYLISVLLGRGARYAVLAGVGVAVPIPGHWIMMVSLVALFFGVRGARKMNRAPENALASSSKSAVAEEA